MRGVSFSGKQIIKNNDVFSAGCVPGKWALHFTSFFNLYNNPVSGDYYGRFIEPCRVDLRIK